MTEDLPRRFGPYRLRARLGQGGMAEVFLASHQTMPGMPRLVALKLIRPELLSDPHFVEMFLDEGRILAGLYHPNLDHVLDVGEIEGRPYLALDYVPGRDLARVLRRHEARAGPLRLDLATQITARVATGLAHAHGRRDASGQSLGIVHRDVSPENVIVTFAGTVKLVDFGIARGTMRSQVTEPGLVKGKPAYMAPEQLLGETIDGRCDVFAAGVLLYRLICGCHPFGVRSDDASTYARLLREVPSPPHLLRPEVPEALSRLLLHALARDPAARLPSADALVEGLEGVMREAGWFPSERRLAALMADLFPHGAVAAARLAEDPEDLSAAHAASWLSRMPPASLDLPDSRLDAGPAPELDEPTETETIPAGETPPPGALEGDRFPRFAPDAGDAADPEGTPATDARLAPLSDVLFGDEASLSDLKTGPARASLPIAEEPTRVDPEPLPAPQRPPPTRTSVGRRPAAAPIPQAPIPTPAPPPRADDRPAPPPTRTSVGTRPRAPVRTPSGPAAASPLGLPPPTVPIWRRPLGLAIAGIAAILVALAILPLMCGR